MQVDRESLEFIHELGYEKCQQVVQHEQAIARHEQEVAELKAQIEKEKNDNVGWEEWRTKSVNVATAQLHSVIGHEPEAAGLEPDNINIIAAAILLIIRLKKELLAPQQIVVRTDTIVNTEDPANGN